MNTLGEEVLVRELVRPRTVPTWPAPAAGLGAVQPRLPFDESVARDTGTATRPSPLVAIVEDHALVADSITMALSVVGVTARRVEAGPHALDGVLGLGPDLVLLDLAVDGDATAGLRLIGPLSLKGLPVVVVTGSTDRLRHAECVEAGALAVIVKSLPMATLVDGVQRALRGESLLSQVERLTLLLELDHARRSEGHWRTGIAALTRREQQILGALVDGHAAGRIAHVAGVSVATVRSHIRSILVKLQVHSQLEAVALAVRLGWRPDDEEGDAHAAPVARLGAS